VLFNIEMMPLFQKSLNIAKPGYIINVCDTIDSLGLDDILFRINHFIFIFAHFALGDIVRLQRVRDQKSKRYNAQRSAVPWRIGTTRCCHFVLGQVVHYLKYI